MTMEISRSLEEWLLIDHGLAYWGRDKNGRRFPDDIYKCNFLGENV